MARIVFSSNMNSIWIVGRFRAALKLVMWYDCSEINRRAGRSVQSIRLDSKLVASSPARLHVLGLLFRRRILPVKRIHDTASTFSVTTGHGWFTFTFVHLFAKYKLKTSGLNATPSFVMPPPNVQRTDQDLVSCWLYLCRESAFGFAMALTFDLWPLKPFSAIPAHMINVCGKFHWNPSTSCATRDDRRSDGQTDGRTDGRTNNWTTWKHKAVYLLLLAVA